MRTFIVITTSIYGELRHEIYDFFIPKEHEVKSQGWYLPFGQQEIPLGRQDIDKLLQTNWKKIPCPARNERKWSGKPFTLVCPKCGEKFGDWRPYKIGFECFHPENGEMVLSDKVVKNAFCLKLRDKYTEEYNGKFLLVAPDKEQNDALIYWKLWDHVPILPDDSRIIAKDTWHFDSSNYLITLKPGSSIVAVKAHKLPADYILRLSYDGNNVQVTEKVVGQGQKTVPAQNQLAL